MAGGLIDVVDQDEVKETWRTWHQPREMSVDQFANQFVIMVSTLETRGGVTLSEAEKARQFILKLNKSLFKVWQAKLLDGEDQQREYFIGGGVGRLPAVGYPQTMVEAIDRAKLQEQQISKTPSSNKKQRAEQDLRSSFAMVDSKSHGGPASIPQHSGRGGRGGGSRGGGGRGGVGRGGAGRGRSGRGSAGRVYLTRDQQLKMSSTTSAKSFGYDPCRHCDDGNNDHFWVHCPKLQFQASRAQVAVPSGGSSVVSGVTTYSEADVANIVEMAIQRDRSFSGPSASGYRRMAFMQQPQYHLMNASFAAKQKLGTSKTGIVLINDTGSSSHDFPMHLVRGKFPIKKNPISHVPINTVQGTYYCEHMSNLPLLGDVHVNDSSDIVVLSLGLLRQNPHVKVSCFGHDLQGCRIEFIDVGLIINFGWKSNVLMGDASELMYVLDEMSYDNSTFVNGEERVTYSRADVRGFIRKYESPNPSVTRDAVIESHLFRHPHDVLEMSNDDVIKASGFFQRNPQFLPSNNDTSNLVKAYTFMKEQGGIQCPSVTYEDDELLADSEESIADSGVLGCYRRAAVMPTTYLVSALDYLPAQLANESFEPVSLSTELSEEPIVDKVYVSKKSMGNALEVKKLQRNLGMFSLRSLADAVLGGAVDTGGKSFTRREILEADMILGADPHYLNGVFTKEKHALNAENKISVITGELMLECDLIFDENLIFLLAVAIPTGWACIKELADKSATSILVALKAIIAFFAFFNRAVKFIRCDGESAMAALADEVKRKFNVQLEPLPTGVHLGVCDRKCRTIKDHVRGARSAIPFAVGGMLLAALYVQTTNIVNVMPTKFNPDSRSPYQELLGSAASLENIARSPPLDTVLVPHEHNQTNRTVNKRMRECIFLHASKPHVLGNATGVYLTTDTFEVIERNHSVSVPTTPTLINKINKLSMDPKSKFYSQPFYKESTKNKRGRPKKDARAAEEITFVMPNEPLAMPSTPVSSTPIINGGVSSARSQARSVHATNLPVTESEWERSGEELTRIAEDIQASFFKIHRVLNPSQTIVDADGGVIYQQFARASLSGLRSVRFSDMKDPSSIQYNFASHMSAKKALELYPEVGMESLIKEIDGMLEREVWIPKFYSDLTTEEKSLILNCSTIVKDKFDLEGNFIKCKSRIVTNGSRQDPSKIPESLKSSPTVSISSVFSVLSVAAAKSMKVVTIDIMQAYLNASMETDIYMWLDPLLVRILITRDKSFEQYVDIKGRILVKLNKAQYGCIESAKLWFNNVSEFLLSLGFKKNAFDQCVFKSKTETGEDFLITLYVDDLMCCCTDQAAIDKFIELLRAKYTTITVKMGDIHDYLAMRFDVSKPGEVFVSMKQYTLDILKESDVQGSAETPAAGNLFELDELSPLLSDPEREKLHRTVAQCLFMATRTRPDIALPIMFLTSRVRNPTVQDQRKLERVLRYLQGTTELGIYLGIDDDNGEFRVICYADASYGVHPGGKSHSGILISHGRGPITAKSLKQKIVCRSSTEAELVALSDATSLAAYELAFFESLGMSFKPVKMHQDNTSTIRLAKNGRSMSDRTKHIKLRYFFVKQYIDTGEFEVVYCPTDLQVADILTKPLQGETFKRLRKQLLGYK